MSLTSTACLCLVAFALGTWISRRRAVARAVASATASLTASLTSAAHAEGGRVIVLGSVSDLAARCDGDDDEFVDLHQLDDHSAVAAELRRRWSSDQLPGSRPVVTVARALPDGGVGRPAPADRDPRP